MPGFPHFVEEQTDAWEVETRLVRGPVETDWGSCKARPACAPPALGLSPLLGIPLPTRCTHGHTETHTQVTHTHSDIHTHIQTHTQIHMDTHSDTDIHAHILTRTHTGTLTDTLTRTRSAGLFPSSSCPGWNSSSCSARMAESCRHCPGHPATRSQRPQGRGLFCVTARKPLWP